MPFYFDAAPEIHEVMGAARIIRHEVRKGKADPHIRRQSRNHVTVNFETRPANKLQPRWVCEFHEENPMKKLQALLLSCVLLSGLMPLFGQSVGTATNHSEDIESRVNSILSQLTLEEKVDLLAGVDGFFIRDVPRLKLPRFKMAD